MRPRQSGLDLLRALAILWVMLYHLTSYGVALPGVVEHGWMGVDLFFVLSGYLIGGQLLRPLAAGDQPSWRGFLLRRALRVLPAYLAVLAIYAAVPAVRESPGLRPLWQFLSFTVNLVPDVDRLAFSHAWSLCVEEHFYVLLPPVVWLLARYPGMRRTAAVALAVLVGGMLLRGALWQSGVAPHLGEGGFVARFVALIYNPTYARLDGLLAGVTLAAVQVFRPSWWAWATRRSAVFLALGLAGLVAATRVDLASFGGAVVVFPLVALSFGGMLVAAATERGWLGRVRVPGSMFLARIAFSLYLTHKAVFHVVRDRTGEASGGSDVIAFGVYIAAALLVATLLYLMVERPFLRLRDRFMQPRGGESGRHPTIKPPAEPFAETQQS
jgi:peptidoglycan/LPS O-acetylase OafA/YrhL